MANEMVLRGVRVHNLKNIDVTIPRDKLVVFTGPSGSGKSSLAFDTIYAEGHRRFVESLSSYARMFLGQLDKPDLDSIEGLSPAISIDQKTTSKNPRSTVGTVTEIYDYLRLLYARVGVPHCPVCGKEIRQQSVDQILDRIMQLPAGTRFMVLSPVVRQKKGRHEKLFADALKDGYVRLRVDGILYETSDPPALDKNQKHSIELVIDRLIMKEDLRARLSDSVETALRESGGSVLIVRMSGDEGDRELSFSTNYACEEHGISFSELEPRAFSFNAPFGACPVCAGIGTSRSISEEKLIGDPGLSLREGCILVNGFKTMTEDSWMGPLAAAAMAPFGVTLDTPLRDYPPEAYQALMHGTGTKTYDIVRYFGPVGRHQIVPWPGVIGIIEQRSSTGSSEAEYYDQFMEITDCKACHGSRLSDGILSVTVGGKNIDQFCRMSVADALAFAEQLQLSPMEQEIVREVLKEIRSRLRFLCSVGLEYLTLARSAGTLSGGEAQRIRLATQIGSSLMGVLYILDEPSIGLHQKDNTKLIRTLQELRDLGNSVLVVEHDEETMEAADYIIDVGPGAGRNGGEIVVAGTPDQVRSCRASVTGDFLSGRRRIAVPAARRPGNGHFLTVVGAREHNLKNITVRFPLGCFVGVSGVSGSGKSTLVNSILKNVLAAELNGAITWPGKHDRVEGTEFVDKVIDIDQSPIGRTPRSNPATYTGLFNDIRTLFARTPAAKLRSYSAGRFSFNVKGGRCEACEGDGVKKIEMHFLPYVYATCDVCHGKRYNRDTLEVKYKGKNIFDVLEMTVEDAFRFFADIPALAARLKTLVDVGLGYIKLGQSATTLSGGEAQRVKLAAELSRRSTGRTVYILDEPTTGLHSSDVEQLIQVLSRLVDAGNTVIVIEHNLDVLKTADYLIDLGPEGGDGGGTVVATGTPEEVAAHPTSYTGLYLRAKLSIQDQKIGT